MNESRPPEPWYSFLMEIDDLLNEDTQLHCLGGFIVTVIYGAERQTLDLDALSLVDRDSPVWEFAGRGSDLHKRHRVYLDRVGIVQLPENYDDRLTEIFAGVFKHLCLFALDPYDVALAKIERNSARDREDVKHLAQVVPFDLELLQRRYNDELRVYLGNPDREDLTLKLWIDMINETRDRS
jgi:hypothetical protein